MRDRASPNRRYSRIDQFKARYPFRVDAEGRLAGDMVFDVDAGVGAEETIVDPADVLRPRKRPGRPGRGWKR